MEPLRGRRKNHRLYPSMRHRPDLAQTRKDEAKERQTAYDKLTVQQKIDLMDQRLGVGIGGTKQRQRLQAQLPQKASS